MPVVKEMSQCISVSVQLGYEHTQKAEASSLCRCHLGALPVVNSAGALGAAPCVASGTGAGLVLGLARLTVQAPGFTKLSLESLRASG